MDLSALFVIVLSQGIAGHFPKGSWEHGSGRVLSKPLPLNRVVFAVHCAAISCAHPVPGAWLFGGR